MRNSMGALSVLGICLSFIVLFTAYLAITLNYSRAFIIKNHIVSFIEEYEGYKSDYNPRIESYLKEKAYDAYGNCASIIPDKKSGGARDWQLQECIDRKPTGECGVCIYRMPMYNEEGVTQSYYRVVNFFKFDIPVIRYVSSFQVSGETDLINDFAH